MRINSGSLQNRSEKTMARYVFKYEKNIINIMFVIVIFKKLIILG